MSHSIPRQAVKWGFTGVLLVMAIMWLYQSGGVFLVLVGTIWPMSVAVGMQSGMRSAPPAAWNRRDNRVTSAIGMTALLSFIFSPAIIAFFVSRIEVGLALFISILLIVGLIGQMFNMILGPVRRLTIEGESEIDGESE